LLQLSARNTGLRGRRQSKPVRRGGCQCALVGGRRG
jgi:hypothetical protein